MARLRSPIGSIAQNRMVRPQPGVGSLNSLPRPGGSVMGPGRTSSSRDKFNLFKNLGKDQFLQRFGGSRLKTRGSYKLDSLFPTRNRRDF